MTLKKTCKDLLPRYIEAYKVHAADLIRDWQDIQSLCKDHSQIADEALEKLTESIDEALQCIHEIQLDAHKYHNTEEVCCEIQWRH